MDHNGAESCGGGAGVLIGRAERFTPEMCTSGVPEETWSSSIAESFDDIASKGRCSIIPGTSTRSCPKPKPGATQVTAFPPAANVAGCGTSISITGSLFWANTGFAVGGIRGFNTFWSATYAGNSWVDNDAVVGHDHGFWNVVPGNFGEKLYSFVDEIYVHTEHCTEDAYRNPYGKGVSAITSSCFLVPGLTLARWLSHAGVLQFWPLHRTNILHVCRWGGSPRRRQFDHCLPRQC